MPTNWTGTPKPSASAVTSAEGNVNWLYDAQFLLIKTEFAKCA